MNSWRKPNLDTYDMDALSDSIKVKAWSVQSAYDMGSFLDQGNQGACGTVYMDPDNEGYRVQVQVIGSIFVAGYYIKTLIDEFGNQYQYKGNVGCWIRIS